MKQYFFRVIFFLSLFTFLNSKNPTVVNEINFDGKKFITLGPTRNGLQRAVFDEVSANDNKRLNEIIKFTNDIEAYDDKFIDLRAEDPLFIPEVYQKEKQNEKITKSFTTKADRDRISLFKEITSIAPVFTTTRRVTLAPVTQKKTSVPPRQQLLPSQPSNLPVQLPARGKPFSQQKLILRPVPTTSPRIVTQKPLPTKTSIPKTNPQASLLVAQLSRFKNQQQQFRPQTIPFKSRTVLPRFTTTISPHIATTTKTKSIKSNAQRSRLPFQPPPLYSKSDKLRTGICHATIFYISSPMHDSRKYTHFALTVSVDQCARTCHEFNCAEAHYDPVTGRCQFNPSTAFAIHKGQCPQWPATHYRNNVHVNIPIRIFCIQCHRYSRQRRPRGGKKFFRTSMVRTFYTGRLPNSVRNSGHIRTHSILLKQSDAILQSSLRNISFELEKQHKHTTENDPRSIGHILNYEDNIVKSKMATKNKTNNVIEVIENWDELIDRLQREM